MWLAIGWAFASEVTLPHAGSEARNPAFSPDGRWLAFEVAHDGAVDLYVTAIGPAGDAGPADAIRMPGTGEAGSVVGNAAWESGDALRFEATVGGAARSYRYTLGDAAATELPEGTPGPVDPVTDRVWFDHPEASRWDIQAALSDGTAIVVASDVGEPDQEAPALLPDGSAVAWVPTDGSAGLRLSRVDGFGTVSLEPVPGLVLGDVAVGARDARVFVALTYGHPPSKIRIVDVTEALAGSGLAPAVAVVPPIAQPVRVAVTEGPDPVAVGRRYLVQVLMAALVGLLVLLGLIAGAWVKLLYRPWPRR